MVVGNVDVRVYFLLFMTYSFLGWVMEVTLGLIQLKKFVNRGFLIGPYCPIYGFGGLLITFLLQKYVNDPIVLFFMALIICGILEYVTSYLMEKIFHARWWDYSNKKYNINGRVCLDTIIPFGLLGLIIMYVTNPFFIEKYQSIAETGLNILFWTILILFLIDNLVSERIIGTLGKTTKRIGKELDNTEEITKKVKEILLGKSALYRRLLKAYPNIQSIKIKVKEKTEEFKNQVNEQTNVIKENVKKQTEEFKEKINDFKDNLK